MKLSIAFITYERPVLLMRALQSIAQQETFPFEVIIIDSSKTKADELHFEQFQKFFTLRYIYLPERRIIPVARNIAIKEALGTHIAFIDDDAEAVPTYVTAIQECFERYEKVGCAGGPAINATADHIPFEPIIRDDKKRVRVLPWGEIRSEIRRWVPTKPIWVDGVQGNNMVYPLDLVRSVGGFDELFETPSFREESDVQMRIKRAGYKVLYHPQAFVWHMPDQAGGISDVEDNKERYFYAAGKNARRFADKYFPKWLSRASWILWSRNPPALIFIPLLTILRKQRYIAWHKGLWEKPTKSS